MSKLTIYCVSNVRLNYLEKLNLKLVGVGKEKFSKRYINCINGINIQHKEKYYSELTFHYWFWKNKLKYLDSHTWVGFCQKRRFWLKKKIKIQNLDELKKNLLRKIPPKWMAYNAIICDPIKVSPAKKIKLLKKGWKNWLQDPTILFNEKKHNIKLQFDMFHGYGLLEKAANILDEDQKKKFKSFISTKTEFNPHIMLIAKKDVLNRWFEDLFNWLFKCEKIFGFKNLSGYETGRLYAYLAERYLSFWFSTYCKSKNGPWTFYE